jgi:signal peptidase II
MKNNLKSLPVYGLLLALFVMVSDQLTKYWALSALFSPPQVIKVLFCFNLVPVWNTGISFGMLAGYSDVMPPIISGLTIVISIGLVGWLCIAKSLTLKVALGLILGGAIGNIIDRIQYGAVIDFIDLHFFGFHWPAFNLADASITIGVGFFLLDSFFTKGVKQN